MPVEERIRLCDQSHRTRVRAIDYMDKYGYTRTEQYSYTNYANIKLRTTCLTRSGLFLLTNTPDAVTEQMRLNSIPKKATKRKQKDESYMPDDAVAVQYRDELLALAEQRGSNPSAAAAFNALFLESLYNGNQLTPLATEPSSARHVSARFHFMKNQIYTAWRLANIEALFRANGALTSIDRRQIDPKQNRKTIAEILEDGRQPDIYEFTKSVLQKWYADHPEALTFHDPYPGFGMPKEQWETAPTFYSLRDIPGFESSFSENEAGKNSSMNIAGTASIMRHSCLGVGIGRHANYLLYHTNPNGYLWSVHTERSVMNAVQASINSYSEKPVFGANRTIQNAIIVCPSVRQFASLFDPKNSPPSKWQSKIRVNTPFQSALIVPLNHAGLMEMRLLLASSPAEIERVLVSRFTRMPEFFSRPATQEPRESIFALSHKGKPVLLALLMDYQKLFWAKQLYDEGMRFHVICYPDQVKFIRQIMPEVTFL